MLGPLPPLHRVAVTAVALAAFVGVGAWLAHRLPVELLPGVGAGIGLAVGTLALAGLLGRRHHEQRAVPVRARSTRR